MLYIKTLALVLTSLILPIYDSIYHISIISISGQQINLSEFQGKRMIVTTFDVHAPDDAHISFLDSLQSGNDSLQVICIPATGGGEALDTGKLLAIQQNNASGLIVSMPARVGRDAGSSQDKLMQWLTDVSRNGRFNMDGRTDQHFLISPSGIFYGALDSGASSPFLKQVLIESYTGQ